MREVTYETDDETEYGAVPRSEGLHPMMIRQAAPIDALHLKALTKADVGHPDGEPT